MSIDRYKDKHGRRHYTDGEVDVLSVTTILNELEEDMTGLEIWKRRNDGTGDNAHHRHLFRYKTFRGTLCHYQALVLFEHVFTDGENMWGPEEAEAMSWMIKNDRERDMVYSIMKDHGYVDTRAEFQDRYITKRCSSCSKPVQTLSKNCPFCGRFLRTNLRTTLTDINRDDVEWFVEAFKEICEELGITDDSIIRVERFMVNEEYGYGGQTDLIYEDPDGNIVIVDLKTSSGLRHKHRLQAVAYAKAAEADDDLPFDRVDRIEVIRIHPDTQTWEVHSDVDASEIHSADDWFIDPWGKFEYDSIEDMWETFKELVDKANDTDN